MCTRVSLHACLSSGVMTHTYDTLGEGGPLERGQSQVSDLDGAGGAGDEDVVALEVAVDDGRGPGVQEVETFQDLTTPAPQHLGLHHLEALQVPTGLGAVSVIISILVACSPSIG